MELEKASLSVLEARYRRGLAVSTQFADTRIFKSTEDSRDTLLLELKTQLLFDDALVLRDTDFVNSTELLDLSLNDAGFRELLTSGICVVGLRESADCLVDVNDRAKALRADPKRHELHKVPIASIDSFIRERHIPVLKIQEDPERDVFHEFVLRALQNLDKKPSEHDVLEKAIRHAERQRDELHPKLRFGEIYRYIWKTTPPKHVKQYKNILDWCHAAHALQVPSQLKIPISSAIHDLQPGKVQAILQIQPKITSADARSILDMYPEYVPTATWLQQVSFSDILNYRQIGEKEGYFGALARLRSTATLPEEDFYGICKDYFKRLGRYVVQLKLEENGGLQGEWKLDGWKKDKVQELYRERNSQNAGLDAGLKVLAIPIIASAGQAMHLFPLASQVMLSDTFNISTQSIWTAVTSVAVLGGLSYKLALRRNPYEAMLGSAQVTATK